MSLSNSAETNLLLFIFNNTNWANIGDATGLRGSTTAGSLYVALHTADPGEAGSQSTNEANFTSYARVAVARSAGGWTVSGDTVTNAGTVTFPTCTGGTNSITHFSIGRASSGAGEIIVSGQLTDLVVISTAKPVGSFAAGTISATAN